MVKRAERAVLYFTRVCVRERENVFFSVSGIEGDREEGEKNNKKSETQKQNAGKKGTHN
jgi:hypothetical protein